MGVDEGAVLAADDASGELVDHHEVVGRDEHGDTGVSVDIGEQVHDLAGSDGVEVARRFVGEDKVGGVDEGAGDADALAFAFGEAVSHECSLVGDTDGGEDLHDAVIDELFFLPAYAAEDKSQVVVDITVVEELEVLEYYAQTAAEHGDLAAFYCREVEAAYHAAAFFEGAVGIEGAEERCLASAAFTDEINELTFAHCEVDVAKHNALFITDCHVIK